MTYWNCLTPDEAIGIHGLQNDAYELYLGRRLSHGCIRIGKDIEQTFYYLVPVGTEVIIE
jgi:lipoprotein-anchoring transpeptidase ErfK/SrfK